MRKKQGYSDRVTAKKVPVGFMFMPTDEELLNYLRKKVNGEKLPTHLFTECNVYGGKNKEPWKLFDKSSNETLYVFTSLNKKSKFKIDRVAGSGFWDGITRKYQVKGLGFKKYLGFKIKNHPRNTENGSWVMLEYSLPDDDSYVVCKIRNKDPTTDSDDDGVGGDGDSCFEYSKKRPLDVGQEDQPRKKMLIGSSSAVRVVQEPSRSAVRVVREPKQEPVVIAEEPAPVLEMGSESLTDNLEDNEVVDKDYSNFLNSLKNH